MAMFQILVQLCQTKLWKWSIQMLWFRLNDTIKTIGEDKFNKTALDEAKVDGIFIPCLCTPCSQVMWVRTDLLKQYNIEVPKNMDQLYEASKKY